MEYIEGETLYDIVQNSQTKLGTIHFVFFNILNNKKTTLHWPKFCVILSNIYTSKEYAIEILILKILYTLQTQKA